MEKEQLQELVDSRVVTEKVAILGRGVANLCGAHATVGKHIQCSQQFVGAGSMASSSDAAFEEELEAMCQYHQGGSSTATDQLELSAPCPEPDHPAITKMEEKLLAARKQVSGTPLLMGAEDLEDLQNEPPPLVSGRQPVLKGMPGTVRATRGSVKQSEEAARKAAKRSLADTVKTRTRGGQANVDDVLEAEAFKVEQLPKKKARAAKLEPGAGPSASTRAQLEHHLPAVKPSACLNMDGAAKEQTAERPGTGTAKGQETAPDGTAVPKRTEKEAKAESADGGALEANGHDKGGKKGGAKKEKKKAPGPAPTPSGEIHCHYCGTRESTYWRRGPDGPKTLCNSCGLNWFRQRPMQREQVEKNNLMAKAVAAAQLKRPANSLKEGPEKRKREEKKDGEKLREQLHGKKGGEALAAEMAGKTKGQLQALKKRRKIEEGGSSAEKGGMPRGLKGLKRAEKASIGRKLGDAAVKKAALIKRTPSQLSLLGLLESAPPPQVPEAVPEVVALKPKGLVKGARFAPLKQAQTRLGAQKLLAVLNVIKQKKGFGRVTSTASLESVPSEQMELFTEGLRKDEQTQGGEAPVSQEWGSDAKDAALEGVPTPRKTGARSQRRPNTALLQGASFLPWKSRPRDWESSSLTFAAAESRLLKSQAANPGAAAGRPPVHKRAEFRPPGGAPTQQEQLEKPPAGAGGLGGAAGAPAVQQRGRMREGLAQGGRPGSPASGLSYEGSDADGFAGYDVLRKLLQEVDVTVTSTTSKGRPPLNRAGKMPSAAPFSKKPESLERPPGGQARPGLKSYESFEDLVMGTAGGMKRYESFEDLALRAGPAFSRIESFEELALKAGPGIRRFESFEDLAMRSEPVFEVPTLKPPPAADTAVVKGEGGSDADQGSEGSREGAGRKSGREKKQKTWDWAVVDGPKRKWKEKGPDPGKLAEERPGLATGVPAEALGQTSEGGGQSLRVVEQLGSRQGQRLDENGQLPLVGGQSFAAQGPGAVGQSAGYTERPDRQPFPATGQSGAAEGQPQPPAGQSMLPPGQSITAVGRPSMVPGEAQPTDGQSLSAFLGTKGQQIPESLVGSLGLQNQGPGLGARGLSARALHLLVDCAVDTEPPAEVNMLMQDLETLAIGNPAMFESRRTLQENGVLEGATGSALQATNGATFALSNAQTFKPQALQPHAVRPLVTVASRGREESLVGGSVGAVGSEGLAAGPPSEGGKGNSGAATMSTPEAHRPVATLTMEEPAKPVRTPQGAPGEPELHCAEELASPEDALQYAGALPGHVPPFKAQQEPGH